MYLVARLCAEARAASGRSQAAMTTYEAHIEALNARSAVLRASVIASSLPPNSPAHVLVKRASEHAQYARHDTLTRSASD